MTTITLPAATPTRSRELPRTRSLQGWTQADADAWLDVHGPARDRAAERVERQMRDCGGDFAPVTPRWGAAEVHGIRTRGTTLTPIQEDGWRAGSVMSRPERGHRVTRRGRRYSQGRQGSGECLGLTPWRHDYLRAFAQGLTTTRVAQTDGTIREEYSVSSFDFQDSAGRGSRHIVATLCDDGVVRRHQETRWTPARLALRPRGITALERLDDDHCPAFTDAPFGRHTVSRGRLLIRDAGPLPTETERLMEITPMITRPAMTTDFIWSLAHSSRREADHYEVDCTDYGTATHDADLRDVALREQVREFGDIRPGTLGRVLAHHIGAARLDRCRVRSGERALDSALRLAFEERASASDWLSLDVTGIDDDGEESSWIPTTGSLMDQWMQSESDEFRAALEAIDWTMRRLTGRQWECLTAEDQSSSTARVTRHQARSIIQRELPTQFRIRR